MPDPLVELLVAVVMMRARNPAPKSDRIRLSSVISKQNLCEPPFHRAKFYS